MRVAVAMSGEMRGFPAVCRESLLENVMQPFKDRGDQVDLFIHTRSDTSCHTALTLPIRAVCLEKNFSLPTSIIVSDANPKDAGDYDKIEPGSPRRGFLYQSYLQQYWSMMRVWNLIGQTEEIHGVYDLVIRTRPDCYLEKPLVPESFSDGRVHVPHNDWWPYEVDGKRVETVCDKFAVGGSGSMYRYLMKFTMLKQFCKNHRIQGEAFTAWGLGSYKWVLDGKPTPWVRDSDITIHQHAEAHLCGERP